MTNYETTSDLRNALLEELKEDPTAVAPVILKLRSLTGKGCLIDPGIETTQFETWFKVIGFLLKKNLSLQAEEVNSALYNLLNELQAKDNERYHKGGAAHQLGLCYLMVRQLPRACWFFTMAFIEDVLSGRGSCNGIPQGHATQALRIYFNWTESRLKTVAATARDVKDESELWPYPEAAAVELARANKLNLPPSRGVGGIPINRPFLKQLMKHFGEGGADAKGKAFEFLASYLAITLPGARIIPNAWALKHEHDMDLIVIQQSLTPTYLLEALGRSFLVECKNWEKTVGGREVNHFVAKMRFHRCRCGVIFAKNGLSGDKAKGESPSYSRLTQLRWYQQDNCIVIVITKRHLEELLRDSMSFSDLLLRGYESAKFNFLEDGADGSP